MYVSFEPVGGGRSMDRVCYGLIHVRARRCTDIVKITSCMSSGHDGDRDIKFVDRELKQYPNSRRARQLISP